VYNKLAIIRHYNNNNRSLKSFKKPSKPRLTRQLAFISFNFKKKPVLNRKEVRRRLESGRL
jgi:ABC-type transport system substrate-binding protein